MRNPPEWEVPVEASQRGIKTSCFIDVASPTRETSGSGMWAGGLSNGDMRESKNLVEGEGPDIFGGSRANFEVFLGTTFV